MFVTSCYNVFTIRGQPIGKIIPKGYSDHAMSIGTPLVRTTHHSCTFVRGLQFYIYSTCNFCWLPSSDASERVDELRISGMHVRSYKYL